MDNQPFFFFSKSEKNMWSPLSTSMWACMFTICMQISILAYKDNHPGLSVKLLLLGLRVFSNALERNIFHRITPEAVTPLLGWRVFFFSRKSSISWYVRRNLAHLTDTTHFSHPLGRAMHNKECACGKFMRQAAWLCLRATRRWLSCAPVRNYSDGAAGMLNGAQFTVSGWETGRRHRKGFTMVALEWSV